MKIYYRSVLVFIFDLLAVAFAWVGAFLLRFNFEWPHGYERHMAAGFALLVPVHAIACLWAGLYRGLWIFASLPDLKLVLRAVGVSSFAALAFVALYRAEIGAPRSMVMLFPLLLMAWMAGGRVIYRMLKEHRLYGGLIGQGKPVVVVGAGRVGAMLVRELMRSPDWRVVGLVDDDPRKWRREVLGCPVLGPVEDLPVVIEAEKVRHVILAIPSGATDTRRAAADLAIGAGAQVLTVPGLDEVMSGRVGLEAIRPLAIDDLLGREPVRIDQADVRSMLSGKTVLVTGAGGSIGSELCRQLARFGASRLVLFESSEYALYTLEQWFADNFPAASIVALVGDVKDRQRLDEVFAEFRPQIVFHAAAYKHVPLMEVGNAWQAVRNNVLGTLRVAECAQSHGTPRFILISTDKAVNPTNVMGATKRLAEMVCESLGQVSDGTRFSMVRFGNVLGSAGSVIPKFQAQIARGGPITVTHPEITRYFMSISEAAQLVLQAASMGKGGEIFVLEMGDPVRIVDLAKNMIRLSGYRESDIRIEFSGLRPGEKLFEELLADTEEMLQTPHPKLRVARARSGSAGFMPDLREWLETSENIPDEVARKALSHWVGEYTPYESKPVLRLVGGSTGFSV